MQVDVPSNPDVVAHDQASAPGKERERDPILGGQVANITNGINGAFSERFGLREGALADKAEQVRPRRRVSKEKMIPTPWRTIRKCCTTSPSRTSRRKPTP